MAAPVQRDQELELRVDSLAFGGNGVARLDGFVVFVRRGLPGDTVRARVTKVQRRHAEAIAHRGARGGAAARRGAVLALPGLRRLPVPGPRLRGAGRGEARVGRATRCAGSAGIADPPLEPIVPADETFQLPQQDGVLVRARPGRAPDARPAPRRPLGRGARDRELLAHDRARERDPQHGARLGARGAARRRTTRRHGTGYLRHLVVREGRNTGQALVQLVTHERERFDRERLIEVLTAFPEVRSIHWSVNDRRPRSRTCRASSCGATRRSRRSSAACASGCARTRSCRRTRAWPSGSTSSRARRRD